MLKVVLERAKERGMICGMIVGSKWPFGGEFLEKDDQAQIVTIETIELKGQTERNQRKQEYDIVAFMWPFYYPDERTKIFRPDEIGEWQTLIIA